MLNNAPLLDWLHHAQRIAREAADIIANIYQDQKSLTIQIKSDNSPLTHADMAADQHIREALAKLTPDIPIVTEETKGTLQFPQPSDAAFWLVDPLDGTKEFIRRTGEFSVNIALIHQHRPILGVVALPMAESCYYAVKDQGAFFQEKGRAATPISVNATTGDTLTIAISRFHCKETEYTTFIDNVRLWHPKVSLLIAGSALKICLVARGLADLYPRFGPTHAWDTAAGHLILNEAKGELVNLKGQPLRYGQNKSLKNPAFIATTPVYLPKIKDLYSHEK